MLEIPTCAFCGKTFPRGEGGRTRHENFLHAAEIAGAAALSARASIVDCGKDAKDNTDSDGMSDIDHLPPNGFGGSVDRRATMSSEIDFAELNTMGLHSLALRLAHRPRNLLADEPAIVNLEGFEGTGPIKFKLDQTAGTFRN